MSDRIIYECANCGWKADINAAWGDIKPKKCGGKKCKTHFQLNPEKLKITVPTKSTLISGANLQPDTETLVQDAKSYNSKKKKG